MKKEIKNEILWAMAKKSLPCGRPLAPTPPPPTAAKLLEWQQQLRSYLSEKKLKYTEQRWAIAKMILETVGHLDAQAMVTKVKKNYPHIGTATVYRNIKVLIEAGILEESHQNAEGRRLYELPHEAHHDHIICLDCGEIFEFHDDQIENLQVKIASRMGFQLEGHRHVIQGNCAYLKKNQKKT